MIGQVAPIRTSGQLFCFVHIEKCGGSTLIDLLRRSFGLRHVDLIPIDRMTATASKADLDWAMKVYPRAFSFAGHSLRPYGEFGALRARMTFYTVLRDPVQRYVSDYLDDCRARGFKGDLTAWSAAPTQHNLQVRALSKHGSVAEAQEVLERDLAFFDFTENYDRFVDQLRTAVFPQALCPQVPVKNASPVVMSGGVPAGLRRHVLNEQELELVRRANALDIALYEWAKAFLAKRAPAANSSAQVGESDHLSLLRADVRKALNKLKRNFIYKPSCGLWPAEVDVLPRYRVSTAELRSDDE